ncbi:DUF4296 domain-containing protein [Psychroserpens sp. SPM9]|uniref:DUF4296 domain-containing protein n=1 Tax=Psychroserpens sp. SPM9 TaxID=2975598 RepID=UPI0021A85AB6|nr:DUF4296 domain-containing protein [Psychroserpens sp. SPM9]MDG5490375.1 DUF4296 domain-containing protein [Psychroserpens sp. SPM9]
MLIAFLGCSTYEKPEKPENLISKDKMVDILYDVFILNAAKGSSKSILENQGVFPQDYVFNKYKIDSLQFAQSNAYYGFYVEEYEVILSKVEQRINADKEKYQKRIDANEKRKLEIRDSIKKLSTTINTNKKDTTKLLKRLEYKDYPDDSK